jgi:O-antigen/teichoic acid export membrane protein
MISSRVARSLTFRFGPRAPMAEKNAMKNVTGAGLEARPAMRSRGIAGNLAWNLGGEVAPALAAVIAIPLLVHRLGAERFGVLTVSWMMAGYFSLFDLGLGRALTQAMAQQWSRGCGAAAAELFWTALAMMLLVSSLAAIGLATAAPWLAHRALKIPPALQGETITGCYLIASGLPMLVSASALRAALVAAERFDLLNLIRTPIGIMSFAAPALMLPFTHNLGWLIGALIANRMISWLLYLIVALAALPDLGTRLAVQPRCILPLLSFGAWITVSAALAPMLVYLDRFFIGALISIAALTAYSVPMEIVSKSFIFPAAVSGVMFPAFARSFTAAAAAPTALFVRAVKMVGLVLLPFCAAVVAFAPQIMSRWIDGRFALQSSRVLQILTAGAFITGLAWIPLALLHGARRPDLPARIHLMDFPIYAMMLWIGIRKFGLNGAALTWTGRLLLENLLLFAMAARFIQTSPRMVIGACAAFAAAITIVAAGAFISDFYLKATFVFGVTMLSGVAAWRFLLGEIAVASRLSALLTSRFVPRYEKVVD